MEETPKKIDPTKTNNGSFCYLRKKIAESPQEEYLTHAWKLEEIVRGRIGIIFRVPPLRASAQGGLMDSSEDPEGFVMYVDTCTRPNNATHGSVLVEDFAIIGGGNARITQGDLIISKRSQGAHHTLSPRDIKTLKCFFLPN